MQRARLALMVLGLPLFGGLASCRVDPDRSSQPSSAPQVRASFGRPLAGLPSVPLAEILAHPESYGDRTVAVEGHVARACTRKGCWMEIADAPGEAARSCRVTFENYAFFVPKDAPGSRARIEGKVVTSRIKPSHVEHLESEGARFQTKNADGSALEVQIVATGVELERRDPKAPRLHAPQGT